MPQPVTPGLESYICLNPGQFVHECCARQPCLYCSRNNHLSTECSYRFSQYQGPPPPQHQNSGYNCYPVQRGNGGYHLQCYQLGSPQRWTKSQQTWMQFYSNDRATGTRETSSPHSATIRSTKWGSNKKSKILTLPSPNICHKKQLEHPRTVPLNSHHRLMVLGQRSES